MSTISFPTHSVVTPIKVSVIIPVYNVEKYIRVFLDSLMMQKSDNLEFIFVDDCGTDSSMAIVEEYMQRDSRIRIIKNDTNIGPGPTRNRGIEFARGEYLAFADPDDKVTPDCYESMYNIAISENADVVRGAVQVFDADGNDITESKPFFSIDAIRNNFKKGWPLYLAARTCHWAMIFSRQLFRDESVRYGTSMSGQDGVFLLQVFLKAKKLAFYEETVYLYSMRPDGLFSRPTFERQLASLKSLSDRCNILKDKAQTEHGYRYISIYADFCLNLYLKYYMDHTNRDELLYYLEELDRSIGIIDNHMRILDRIPAYHELKALAEKS